MILLLKLDATFRRVAAEKKPGKQVDANDVAGVKNMLAGLGQKKE